MTLKMLQKRSEALVVVLRVWLARPEITAMRPLCASCGVCCELRSDSDIRSYRPETNGSGGQRKVSKVIFLLYWETSVISLIIPDANIPPRKHRILIPE